MESIRVKRSFINNMGYMFIPLTNEVRNEGDKCKVKLSTDVNNVVFIPKGEDIESSTHLKNKLGVVIELVD